MKVTTQDYKTMEKSFIDTYNKHQPKRSSYKNEMRFRWAIFNSSKWGIEHDQKCYYDDDHIDTALRKIVKSNNIN